jgi:hypothetical protein
VQQLGVGARQPGQGFEKLRRPQSMIEGNLGTGALQFGDDRGLADRAAAKSIEDDPHVQAFARLARQQPQEVLADVVGLYDILFEIDRDLRLFAGLGHDSPGFGSRKMKLHSPLLALPPLIIRG